MLRFLRTSLCALFIFCFPADGFSQQITLDEARFLARVALQRGEPQLALNIAKGLLDANPKDPTALLIVAAAQSQLGNPINGRRAAARAYRNAKDNRVKLDAASIAARLALNAKRPTLTQIWLRRASQQTTDPIRQKQIASDYRRVRAENPWSFDLDFSVRPSSNVNNGSDVSQFTVDGVDTIDGDGQLSASSQALSGLIAQGQLNVGYRLRSNAKSRTDLLSRVRIQRVDLSDDARALADQLVQDAIAAGDPAPDDPRNRDFGSTYTDLTLQHSFRVGTNPSNIALVSFGFGALWYGGDLQARVAQLRASRRWAINPKTSFTLYGTYARRDQVGSTISDSNTLALQGAIMHKLDSGSALSVSLGVSDTRADRFNLENTSWSLRSNYSFAKNWGPAKVTAGLSFQDTHFPQYSVSTGVTTIAVPGGRQDQAFYADLKLFFEDYDYAGFAPELTIRAGKRSSNVNRFDTREVSASIGIQSKF
ncbi:MAG: hypothetical protein ABJL99_18080 [Aliishimia sp.]